MPYPVRRRAVFMIGGYEPKTPEAFFRRLFRQLRFFDKLWHCSSEISAEESVYGGDIGKASIRTNSDKEAWSTQIDFSFLSLDSIVLADFEDVLPLRLWRYLCAFADFAASGTAFRFFVTAWRFGLYFLYPFIALAFFALAGLGFATVAWPLVGYGSFAIGVVVFWTVLSKLGQRWSTNHLMDLWSFSAAFIRGRRPDAETLLQRYAQAIVDQVGSTDYDEVILVGHSTGGMLMIDVAARCLRIEKNFGRSARNVTLLTLGSTALKAGLHPAGRGFRMAVEELVSSPHLGWVEIQCLTDPINFYKTDPVREMDIQVEIGRQFPMVRTIKVRDMVSREMYRKIRRSFFRVHYQYVYANTKPYWYDFMQVACGPRTLIDRVVNGVKGQLGTETLST